VNSAFPTFSFIHLSPHSWNSFNRSLFSIYIHSICTIFTFLQPFPISSPLPLVPTSPGRTCFTLLPSNFVIKKKVKTKMTFLVKMATQGVSLWHFHVYMYYSPIWFNSSVFLLSTLVPFLWWFQLV
jgi:hypothetical protein